MTLKALFIAALAVFPFAIQAMEATTATPAPVAEQAPANKAQENHRVAPVTIQEEAAVKIQETAK